MSTKMSKEDIIKALKSNLQYFLFGTSRLKIITMLCDKKNDKKQR